MIRRLLLVILLVNVSSRSCWVKVTTNHLSEYPRLVMTMLLLDPP